MRSSISWVTAMADSSISMPGDEYHAELQTESVGHSARKAWFPCACQKSTSSTRGRAKSTLGSAIPRPPRDRRRPHCRHPRSRLPERSSRTRWRRARRLPRLLGSLLRVKRRILEERWTGRKVHLRRAEVLSSLSEPRAGFRRTRGIRPHAERSLREGRSPGGSCGGGSSPGTGFPSRPGRPLLPSGSRERRRRGRCLCAREVHRRAR